MRSFAFAALVGTAAAAPAIIFAPGDVPTCTATANGGTFVEYSSANHPSFKCTLTSASTCACAANHPTHHLGSCREFDAKHHDGSTKTFHVGGDCTDSGMNTAHGAWSSWTASGTCSETCGDGLQSYTRTCDGIVNGGDDCSGLDGGSATKTESCKLKDCPVYGGVWSDWITDGSCSADCGDGLQSYTRACGGIVNGTWADNGARDCDGSATKTESCKIKECPVHGSWSAWAEEGACSADCGDGLQTYSRTCGGVAFGGLNCSQLDGGNDEKTEPCKIKECPIHGVWSDWTQMGACSAECGDGLQIFTRMCQGQAHGGDDCEGDATMSTHCKIMDCPEPIVFPVDGHWSAYSSWSTCSATCGTGTQTATRTCDGIEHGGADCSALDGGSATATQSCKLKDCRTCTEYPAKRALYLGAQVEMSAGGYTYGQPGISKADCEAACEDSPECQQTVWYNNHCYPMKAASATDSVGDNAAFTTYQCSSTAGRQCTTKTSWRAKYPGDQSRLTADGIAYGESVTLERCTLACEKTADCKLAVWFAGAGLCFPTNAASDEVEPGDYNAAEFTSVFCGAPTAPVKAPIHGVWSDWTASGSCSANCGDGLQTYTRTCTPPAHGGDDCSGDATKTEACKLKECPVNGGWSGYGGWGSCSAGCGGGTKYRSRSCTNPSPAHGGAGCSGGTTDSASCNTQACPITVCVSGYSSGWGSEYTTRGTSAVGGLKDAWWNSNSDHGIPGGSATKAQCQSFCAGKGAPAFNWANGGNGCRCYTAAQRSALTVTGSGWQMCSQYVKKAASCVQGYSSGWGSEYTTRGTTAVGGLKGAMWISTSNHGVPGGSVTRDACQQYCAVNGAPAFNWANGGNGCRCYTAAQRSALTVTGSGWSMCTAY